MRGRWTTDRTNLPALIVVTAIRIIVVFLAGTTSQRFRDAMLPNGLHLAGDRVLIRLRDTVVDLLFWRESRDLTDDQLGVLANVSTSIRV